MSKNRIKSLLRQTECTLCTHNIIHVLSGYKLIEGMDAFINKYSTFNIVSSSASLIKELLKQHLHIRKVLCFGKVGEVLNHKLFGTSEEGGGAVGLSKGEEGQAVTKIHGSYQEVAACSGQD